LPDQNFGPNPFLVLKVNDLLMKRNINQKVLAVKRWRSCNSCKRLWRKRFAPLQRLKV